MLPGLQYVRIGELWLPFCHPSKQSAKMHVCCKRAVIGTHDLDGTHVGAIAHRPDATMLALCAYWRAPTPILKAFIQSGNRHACCESSVMGTHDVDSAHVGAIAHRPDASRLHHSIAVEARVPRRRRRPCASKASPVINLLLRLPCHRRMLSQVAACTAHVLSVWKVLVHAWDR